MLQVSALCCFQAECLVASKQFVFVYKNCGANKKIKKMYKKVGFLRKIIQMLHRMQ